MSTDATTPGRREQFMLFLISCIALFTIGFHFSLRSGIAGDLSTLFGKIDSLHSSEMVGAVLGVCFLGYGITILISSPLVDAIGMGRLVKLSGALMAIGSVVVVLADSIAPDNLYRVIWVGMLIVGIGWGLVDATTNPLVASLYPDEKTHRLNALHAWWPAGIIVGGLAGLAFGAMNIHWKIRLALGIIPAVIYAVMCFSVKFPPTERAAAGISFGDMFKEILRRPMFWVWFGAIWLTATSELAPGQWVDMALTRTVGMRGIWLLIYISGLMFVMRHFAGPVVKKLSPVGLLWVSCLLAAIGLGWLSISGNPVTALLAATFWGVGVCYMWPTMLATVNDRYPRAGALGIGLIGSGATLAIYFFLPVMGRVYDAAKISAAGGEDAFNKLAGAQLNNVLVVASQSSFRFVALLPAALLLVFGAIWMYDTRKGVKIETLGAESEQVAETGDVATERDREEVGISA